MPKITILTPSKNGSRFLRSTIDSILAQDFKDWEHIVVDGCSTDGSLDILRGYGHIRWTSLPDEHSDEAAYRAMMMSGGEYLMFCCISDGYLDKGWFGRCVKFLESHPKISLVYGLNRRMTDGGELGRVNRAKLLKRPPPQGGDYYDYWRKTTVTFPEQNFCVRRDVFWHCFPKWRATGDFRQSHCIFAFNYNFNTTGYWPYFLPVVASYFRSHHGSNSIRMAESNTRFRLQYRAAIKDLKK